MCKYCELKDRETIILDEEKYTKLIIQRNRNNYYLLGIGEGLESEFKLKYCPMCGRDLQNESSKEIKDENNKFTITNSISIKDIFKYESRFSGSDEFDEL